MVWKRPQKLRRTRARTILLADTKEEPKEDSEEQHEQDEEKPSNLPSDSWDGLDAETRAVLEKVKPDLLDQLPCSSSPKLS